VGGGEGQTPLMPPQHLLRNHTLRNCAPLTRRHDDVDGVDLVGLKLGVLEAVVGGGAADDGLGGRLRRLGVGWGVGCVGWGRLGSVGVGWLGAGGRLRGRVV
jgi:hypothetical protein